MTDDFKDVDLTAVLARLYETIVSRKGADAASSYTASLFAGGRQLICDKVSEETAEAIVEGLKGDAPALTRESADILYHLMVLWAEAGVKPEDVWVELARREGTSGIAEKASRPKKDDPA
jgi:phosphoribosyl-ATP pyrophosphohydrolase